MGIDFTVHALQLQAVQMSKRSMCHDHIEYSHIPMSRQQGLAEPLLCVACRSLLLARQSVASQPHIALVDLYTQVTADGTQRIWPLHNFSIHSTQIFTHNHGQHIQAGHGLNGCSVWCRSAMRLPVDNLCHVFQPPIHQV